MVPIPIGQPPSSRTTRGRARARGLRRLLVLLLALVFPDRSVVAAELGLTSTFPSALLVGETGSFDIGILATGEEGPGDVSLTFQWYSGRELENALGAFVLTSLPSALSASYSVILGADCQASLGALQGSCGITVRLAEPVQSGFTPLARIAFQYLWVPNPGYALCFDVTTDPSCIEANQLVTIRTPDASVFGQPSSFSVAQYGTFGRPGVRVIPEPSSAALIGIGLAALAGSSGPRGRRPAR